MNMNFLHPVFQRSDLSGSRSTILKPLTWLVSIMFASLILLLKVSAPDWIIISLSISLGITVLILLGTYLYCLFTDKDAIRSESYSIQKMAIEKGVFGDDSSGTFNKDQIEDVEYSELSDESETSDEKKS